MKLFYTISCLFLIFNINTIQAQQTGNIRGTVKDKNTQETIIGAIVQLENSQLGVTSDLEGNFKITNVPVGSYNVKASLIGYQAITKFNVNVTSGNDQVVNFEIIADNKQLKEVEITFDKGKSASAADMITPLSVQSLTTEEIRSNPGGNFDISRVIQVLPGVAGAASTGFRNDIIIRGGAPNENVYYLDGIEIPVINHFQTQGASGGPAGILNVSFIEDVKLSSSAFDAKFDNALASVFQFKQREGNPERVSGNIRLSSSELSTTFEGPLSKKTNYLVSARRSYLQLLFELIDLPIRPNYWDFQYKVTHKINAKTTITAIGVGAIDEFSLSTPKVSSAENAFLLNSTPSINQWNYTVGFTLKRLIKNGFVNVALSRNMFDNKIDRFENKDIGNETARILKINSQEIENKFRLDINKFVNNWKFSYGVVGQYVKFNNLLFNRIRKSEVLPSGQILPAVEVNYESNIEFYKFGAFAQAAKRFLNDKLLISAGLRSDGNTFMNDGANLLNTLSPRLSVSLALSSKLNLNASVGDYYKIPTYTLLGFKNNNGDLVNKDTKYIRSTHYVTGFEYRPKESMRFTLEGFFKQYRNYPVSVVDGISLANLGGGFDVVGNEAVRSNGNGETYGFEFYYQQKLIKRTFAVFSYTYVRSKFSGADGKLVASAWDNRHLFSALFGYKLKRGWEIGAKFRFAGGTPFTPFDTAASRFSFATSGQGVLDFSRLNTERLINFSQFDIRVDKKFYFKKSTLDLYIDIQNLLRALSPALPNYTFKRNADNSGFETTDGQALTPDGSNGIPVILLDQSPLAFPGIGFIFEF